MVAHCACSVAAADEPAVPHQEVASNMASLGYGSATATAPRRSRWRAVALCATGAAFGLAVVMLGIATDWPPDGVATTRGRAGSGLAVLLQTRLDLFSGSSDSGDPMSAYLAAIHDGGDEDFGGDGVSSQKVRNEMLAAGAPATSTQSLSWLDWSAEDIEKQELGIRQKLIKIEQALIAQPQKLNEMKVAMGAVEQYYGNNGKLRAGVPVALELARARLQQAEDKIMKSERMRKLTADLNTIRTGAKTFLKAQRTKDFTQDQLLDWTQKSQKNFRGISYEHMKTLKRHLRGDERDISRYRREVKRFMRKNRRLVARGMRRKKEEVKAKGRELIKRFFGEGKDARARERLKRKSRGRQRVGGLWDAIEDAAKANVSAGLAGAFARWDAAVGELQSSMRAVGADVDGIEPSVIGWNRNLTWRLGNLTESIDSFKHINVSDILPLSVLGREQWREIQELQEAIDEMAERRAVAMDPCLGIRETSQALDVLIAMLTQRADLNMFNDLESQKKLNAVRALFYKLMSQRLDDMDRRKMFEVLVGAATQKNGTAYEVEAMTEERYRAAVARINAEQEGVIAERALILTILKLLSRDDYSEAQDKISELSRLKNVGPEMQALFAVTAAPNRRHLLWGEEGSDTTDDGSDADDYAERVLRASRQADRGHFQSWKPDAGGMRGRRGASSLRSVEEDSRGGALREDARVEGGLDDTTDPDIYSKVDGRYKYGMDLRDTEEIRVVKGIMLKILLQLDAQESNLQDQLDLWAKILSDRHAARIKWEQTLLDGTEKMTNLSAQVDKLGAQVEVDKSELAYRKDDFNATHSAFLLEQNLLNEEIGMLRRARARAQQKVDSCDLQRELNGGSETPRAVAASAKAAAAWKVLMKRLERHNATANFIHDTEPAAPDASAGEATAAAAAAASAHAAYVGLSGRHSAAARARVLKKVALRDRVLQSLKAALQRLKVDEDTENKLRGRVAFGRRRLDDLHRQLAQAAMMQQLAAGKPLRSVVALAHGRGREGADQDYELDRFQRATAQSAHAYHEALTGLDAKIEHLHQLAASKRVANTFGMGPQQDWGHSKFMPQRAQGR